MMRRILHDTNAIDYRCYLSGGRNYRYDIYPEYKANRRDTDRPRHLESLREFLVTDWKATVTDGIEADDALGIEQIKIDGESMICSIDKDLLMIPGKHFNFVKGEFRHVSPLEGLRHFYFQLLMGDRADNIFGFDGKARNTVPKFLQHIVDKLEAMTEEQEMYDLMVEMYDNDIERLNMNGKVLWIQREEGIIWQPPSNGPTPD